MTNSWHVSLLTPAERDICESVLDVCLFMTDDAVAQLALALLCGTVERAGLSQREYLLHDWRAEVSRLHG